jgi:hypothetical protein
VTFAESFYNRFVEMFNIPQEELFVLVCMALLVACLLIPPFKENDDEE